MATTTPTSTLIRMPDVLEMTGLSRATIDRRVKARTFPQPVPLSDSDARSAPIGFALDEVQGWIEERKNARTTEVA
jgi:prophage regulatory protein